MLVGYMRVSKADPPRVTGHRSRIGLTPFAELRWRSTTRPRSSWIWR
jgi:hypothetical protein